MQRLVQITAALVLSLTLGLHWMALQGLAWTTMVIERSHSASFAEALQTTFDGQHPCNLCRFVKEGKSAEQSPDVLVKLPKLEVFSTPLSGCLIAPFECEPLAVTAPSPMTSRTTPPLLTPPRRA